MTPSALSKYGFHNPHWAWTKGKPLCIRAEKDQNVKPALVFRGKGPITSLEKQSYNERVNVYFQQNAWMDTELNMQWCNNTLFPGVGKNDQEKVIFQTM